MPAPDAVPRLNAALEGRYHIERELGEGGMATVYLAKDLKHNRSVALKVLKPELAAVVGAERFLAEIETTANLQHPHILPLHDSGEADGGPEGGRFLYFVMPYVAGETLRDRIDREKQLGVDEALGIATKIGSALQYAHSHGVVHRDIKPGNILLSEQGEPIVADFGIALAVAQAGGGRVTETGLSLGTPHYMSPEQATGDRDVDPRTDVYALGCVLYEMLTGDPPYQGSTAQAVLGQIIAGEMVPVVRKRPAVPAHVDAALRKAVEKIPADRFTSAVEFTRALGDRGFRHGEGTVGGGDAGSGRRAGPLAAGLVLGALTGGTAAVALGALGLLPGAGGPTDGDSAEVIRFAIQLPEGLELETAGNGHDLAISPDGRMVVSQSGVLGGALQLNLTYLDRFGSTPIRGTEEAAGPVFSPDGEWIAFQPSRSAQIIRRVSVQGGPPLTVTEAPAGVTGVSWREEGRIVFGVTADGLYQVPAAGGDPVRLTMPDSARGEIAHLYPDVIPGSGAVVFTLVRQEREGSTLRELAVLEEASGDVTPLGIMGTRPRFVSTGHLVYAVEDGSLRAVPFSRSSLTVTGSPVPVVEDVQVKGTGTANFDVSRNGRLLYAQGTGAGGVVERPLLWVDRNGETETIPAPLRNYVYPRLSPDDRIVALDARDESSDIWLWSFSAQTLTRMVLGDGAFTYPVWSPDGATLAYAAPGRIVQKASNNTGQTAPLFEIPGTAAPGRTPNPYFFTPDGNGMVYRDQGRPDTDDDLVMISFGGGTEVEEVWRLGGEYAERNAELSPDGRWMAYQSNQSGQWEVYVRPFPDVDSDFIQISNLGGIMPAWSKAGNELFYLQNDPTAGRQLVSVAFEVGPDGAFRVAGREAVLEWSYSSGSEGRTYDVAADGRRFLVVGQPGTVGENESQTTELTVVLNWFTELVERAGPGG